MKQLSTAAAALAAAALLAACGAATADTADGNDTAGGAAGACLAGSEDCNDIGAPADQFPVDQARSDAKDLLGAAEAVLTDDIRVSRRGEETFMLTEDYMLGRMTVELDEHDGGFVVTSVTLELPDGPETFTS
jgi:ABC-type amino acid transport substrate-binding protein